MRKYNIEAILISAMERPKPESRLSPYLIAALTASAILLAVVVVDQLEQQRFAKVREARILRNMSNVRARLEGEKQIKKSELKRRAKRRPPQC